jgi:spore coat polysaccharide biosynthesis predicted glycosyltransferase SpsG
MEKILFRTSGGRIRKKELGLGHVFRCINLGYQLKSHQIQFLIEDYGSVSPLLHEHGFKKIFNLIPGISINDDIKKTVAHIYMSKLLKKLFVL